MQKRLDLYSILCVHLGINNERKINKRKGNQ